MPKPIEHASAPQTGTNDIATHRRSGTRVLFLEILLYAAVTSFGFTFVYAAFLGESGLRFGEAMLKFWYISAGLTAVLTYLLFKHARKEEQDQSAN